MERLPTLIHVCVKLLVVTSCISSYVSSFHTLYNAIHDCVFDTFIEKKMILYLFHFTINNNDSVLVIILWFSYIKKTDQITTIPYSFGQSKHIISNINSNLLRALSFHRPNPNPNRFSLSPLHFNGYY